MMMSRTAKLTLPIGKARKNPSLGGTNRDGKLADSVARKLRTVITKAALTFACSSLFEPVRAC